MDELIGTAGNDTFEGLVEDLSIFDDLDGGAGDDVLNLYVEDLEGVDSVDSSGAVDVEGIETINFIYTGEAVGTGTIDGDTFQGATQIWQIDGVSDVIDLAATQTAGFRDEGSDGGAGTVSVTAKKGAATLSVALDGVASGSRANFEGVDVTTINVSGSVAKEEATDDWAELNLGGQVDDLLAKSLDKLDTVNLELTSDTALNTFTEALYTVVTIDAAASTGGIKFALEDSSIGDTEVLALEALSTGSGADELTVEMDVLAAEAVTINAGDGNDRINIDVDLSPTGEDETDSDVATALTVDSGAGSDTVFLAGGNVSLNNDDSEVDPDGFDGNTINIVNFNDDLDSGDLLIIEGFDGFFTQLLVTTQNAAFNNAKTLFEAVDAVARVVANGEQNEPTYAKFDFDGNTYVYGNTDNSYAPLSDEDFLVEITGGATLIAGDNVSDEPISVGIL